MKFYNYTIISAGCNVQARSQWVPGCSAPPQICQKVTFSHKISQNNNNNNNNNKRVGGFGKILKIYFLDPKWPIVMIPHLSKIDPGYEPGNIVGPQYLFEFYVLAQGMSYLKI